jgi:hypothetical protein
MIDPSVFVAADTHEAFEVAGDHWYSELLIALYVRVVDDLGPKRILESISK